MGMQTDDRAKLRQDILDLSPQELGREGERLAASYLERRGCELVARNWSCPLGEVDIIAIDGDECVFVEVKTRLVESFDTEVWPELAVDAKKKRRYVRMAEYFMAREGLASVRFDVIGVQVIPQGIVTLRHTIDAFGCDR